MEWLLDDNYNWGVWLKEKYSYYNNMKWMGLEIKVASLRTKWSDQTNKQTKKGLCSYSTTTVYNYLLGFTAFNLE